MSESDIKKIIQYLIVELETLKMMLIQHGNINSIEFETLKKIINQEVEFQHLH